MDTSTLQPGDKVRIIQEQYLDVDFAPIITVPSNSIGTIMSFDDYCIYMRRRTHVKHMEEIEDYCSMIEQHIQNGDFLPVKIETLAPLSADVQEYWSKMGWKGDVRFEPWDDVILIDIKQVVKIA